PIPRASPNGIRRREMARLAWTSEFIRRRYAMCGRGGASVRAPRATRTGEDGRLGRRRAASARDDERVAERQGGVQLGLLEVPAGVFGVARQHLVAALESPRAADRGVALDVVDHAARPQHAAVV